MSANNGEGSSSSSQVGLEVGPQQQPAQPTVAVATISEELCYHNLDCPFYLLSRQKSNLLTDSEMHSELVAHYLRKWNTTLESSGGTVVARAMAYSNQALETGKVRDYLNSQRSQLDRMIQRELAKCQCITARILLQNPEENIVKVEVEQGDLQEAVHSPPILVKEEPLIVEVELGETGTEEVEGVVMD